MTNVISKTALSMLLVVTTFSLYACGNSGSSESSERVEIKAAPVLSNDATEYANKAWQLINQIDPVLYHQEIDQIDEQVRKPLRQLSTDWRINVKMTDSVTEGKYALCRKAMTSLDTWARELKNQSRNVNQRQLDYERDKTQCKGAIEHPDLGNTDPKRVGV